MAGVPVNPMAGGPGAGSMFGLEQILQILGLGGGGAPAVAAPPTPPPPPIPAQMPQAGPPVAPPMAGAAAPMIPIPRPKPMGPGMGQPDPAQPQPQETADPLQGIMSSLGGVKAPAAPQAVMPSTPGAPRPGDVTSNLLQILNQAVVPASGRQVELPSLSRELSRFRG